MDCSPEQKIGIQRYSTEGAVESADSMEEAASYRPCNGRDLVMSKADMVARSHFCTEQQVRQ